MNEDFNEKDEQIVCTTRVQASLQATSAGLSTESQAVAYPDCQLHTWILSLDIFKYSPNCLNC